VAEIQTLAEVLWRRKESVRELILCKNGRSEGGFGCLRGLGNPVGQPLNIRAEIRGPYNKPNIEFS